MNYYANDKIKLISTINQLNYVQLFCKNYNNNNNLVLARRIVIVTILKYNLIKLK